MKDQSKAVFERSNSIGKTPTSEFDAYCNVFLSVLNLLNAKRRRDLPPKLEVHMVSPLFRLLATIDLRDALLQHSAKSNNGS